MGQVNPRGAATLAVRGESQRGGCPAGLSPSTCSFVSKTQGPPPIQTEEGSTLSLLPCEGTRPPGWRRQCR